MKSCYKCGREWNEMRQPGSKETCEGCGSDLRVCRNCRFYDEHKPDQCAELGSDPVRDKERSNFCDYFQFSDVSSRRQKSSSSDMERFEKLFKKNDLKS